MKLIPKVFLFGFLLWLSVLIVAMLMVRIRETDQIFFESLIAITLAFFTGLYATIYFKKVEANQFRLGFIVGIIWMSVSLLLDYPVFALGPMKMGFEQYLKDIGLTYIMIPVITSWMGYAVQER